MVVRLLRESVEAKVGVIFDDLLEHITKPDTRWMEVFALKSLIPDCYSLDGLCGIGIEELCRLQGLTLLGHYRHAGIMRVPMSPAVKCFESWLERELETP